MMLRLEHVSKTFPGAVRAVADVSFELAPGELVVLVGPSGCGKSTLLRLIAGLEEPDGGRILFDGRDARHIAPKDRGVAMLFQNHVLFPHLSVADNLAFGLRLRGEGKAEIARRVNEAAELLQIMPLLQRRPHELSGGERQRAALGRAIVGRPRLFLFDEPLSNLDAWLKADLRREIEQIHRRLGRDDPGDARPGRLRSCPAGGCFTCAAASLKKLPSRGSCLPD